MPVLTPAEADTLAFLETDQPALVDRYLAALRPARRRTLGLLTAALLREGLVPVDPAGDIALPDGPLRVRIDGEHAFGRPQIGAVLADDRELEHPAELLALLIKAGVGGGRRWEDLATELSESVANLAMSYACVADRPVRSDLPHLQFDRLCAEGHNIHPCGRARGGMRPAESFRYAGECAGDVRLAVVAVRLDHLSSTEVGDLVRTVYPEIVVPPGYGLVLVHPWQLEHVIPAGYAAELAGGTIRVLDFRIRSTPTVSLRTVVTDRGLVVKTALDLLITTSRRSISPATTYNTPRLGLLLRSLIEADPELASRAQVVREVAGACFRPETGWAGRNLSTVLREDPSRFTADGETAVTGCALYADGVLAVLIGDRDPLDVLAEYAALLLPVVLTFLTGHGIGLEAHLQNTVVVWRDGRPVRLLLRDLAGIRIDRTRFAGDFEPHPDSIIVVDGPQGARHKAFYCALQANLAEVISTMVAEFGVAESDCWDLVRAEAHRVFDRLETRWPDRAIPDRAAMFAPTLGQKSFLRMRLHPGTGDAYIQVPNPLHS
ncbi:hypothetical protein D5S17_06870 [Pseudonocardiaceae bacterium YIM PH 21723]|nr:hypothetical protein D5S17_06870 [Pseudonocardiaceae bacterium YIM PH 21723]